MPAIADQILRRIRTSGRGAVFVPKDFLDLGGRAAVDQALSRLARGGTIRRVGRGIYDYPRVSPRLGVLSPPPDAVARAAARGTDSRLQVSGAQAANALGVSSQVPARLTYLTDGASRHIQVGGQTITLRHAAPSHMVGAGTMVGLVLQALRYLGRDGIDQRVVHTIASQLSPGDARALRRAAAYVADWMRPVIARIIATASSHAA